jgi:hypothetical protein
MEASRKDTVLMCLRLALDMRQDDDLDYICRLAATVGRPCKPPVTVAEVRRAIVEFLDQAKNVSPYL